MTRLRYAALLISLSAAAHGCSSSKPAEPASEPATAQTPPAASPCAFDRTLTNGETTVRVSVPPDQACSIGTVEFVASFPGGVPATFSHERDGTVTDAWLLDLDGNGALDVAVATRAAGSGSYGYVVIYELAGGMFQEKRLTPLTDDQRKNYRGSDHFEVVEGVLHRSFPLYGKDDPLAAPSGGTALYRYAFDKGRWVEGS